MQQAKQVVLEHLTNTSTFDHQSVYRHWWYSRGIKSFLYLQWLNYCMARGESVVSGAVIDKVVFWLLTLIAFGGVLLVVLYATDVISFGA